MNQYVVAAMQSGVGFVCAHCENFWWGARRGLDKCKAFYDGKECAGPGKFMAFPEYKGPLKNNFHKYCFVCGKEPKFLVEIPIGHGLVRNIGVCQKDREILFDFRVSKHMPASRPTHKINRRKLPCPVLLPKN